MEEFKNEKYINLQPEEENQIEDEIIGELLQEESVRGAKEKVALLFQMEEESNNSRNLEKVQKLADISSFKCNGSNVGNVILGSMSENFLPSLEENIVKEKETMDLNQLGEIVTKLEAAMENKRLPGCSKSKIASSLFNLFLLVNKKK